MANKFKQWWKSFVNWLVEIGRTLWEDYLKEQFMAEIGALAKEAIEQAKVFKNSDTYIVKRDAIVNYIFDKIVLPKWMVPFKRAIKAILIKNIDKLIDSLLAKAEEDLNK